MDILFANNAKTLLDGTLAIDETSTLVDDASLFPAPTGSQFFYATIQNPSDDTDYEIVKCTAVSGNTVTIERAQESTVAQEWSDGSLFELRLTNGGIEALKSHESDHIQGGSAEIDGDQLDIDFSPFYYAPNTSPGEVTHLDHLSAHLSGIDVLLAPASLSARGTIELATHDEAKAGSETGMAITPSTLAGAMKQQSWMQADGYYIGSDTFRARDADGLRLEDDGGNGITIADGGAVSLDKSGQFPYMPILSKTADYNVTTSDFGKSIRFAHASTTGTMTLPSVGPTEDGARLTFIKTGNGRLVLGASDSDAIYDSTAGGTIYSDSYYATITIEYIHAETAWVIISAVGVWTTT
jgi:hypothetical protein